VYVCILCVIHAYMWMRRILLVRACFGCVCNVCMRSICTKCMHACTWLILLGLGCFCFCVCIYMPVCGAYAYMGENKRDVLCLYVYVSRSDTEKTPSR